MPDQQNVPSDHEVFLAELGEIAERRRAAGFACNPPGERGLAPADEAELAEYHIALESDGEQAGPGVEAAPVRDRVGLALSGGGIRSASFNLGLLQALYNRGLLRHVDYLSTVSGGGYVGSYLTSLANHPRSSLAWTTSRPQDAAAGSSQNGREHDEALTIASEPSGRQPPLIRKLIHGGMYLRKPVPFVNRYLLGLLAINLIVVSGLLAVAAAVAWLVRCMDYREAIRFADALGFRGDIRRAFLPGFGLLVLWSLLWILRAILEPRRPSEWLVWLTRVVCVLMLTAAALAVVSLLVTGDIALTETASVGQPAKTAIHRTAETLMYLLLAVQLLALLPAFRLDRLIRSGAQPRNLAEGIIFNVASTALVFGIPLLFFGFFAREDLAGTVSRANELHSTPLDHRVPQLLSFQDVRDWSEFWRTVEEQARAGRPEFRPSERLWQAAQSANWEPDPSLPRGIGPVEASLLIDARHRRLHEQVWFPERLAGLAVPLGGEENPFVALYRSHAQRDRVLESIIESVNRLCLSDPQFFVSFTEVGGEDDAQRAVATADVPAIVALRERARGLSGIFPDAGRALQAGVIEDLDSPAALERMRLREVQNVNRSLLEAWFGDLLHNSRTVFAYNVIHADQLLRLQCAGVFALLFLVSAYAVSLNGTSLHGFYREGLNEMWIVNGDPQRQPILLSRLYQDCGRAAPYLLINATAHLSGRQSLGWLLAGRPPSAIERDSEDRARSADGHPAGESRARDAAEAGDEGRLAKFLFSRRFCGSRRIGYARTEHYCAGKCDLASAMALSGSVVNPMTTSSFPLRVMLMFANVRLGQWLPNPSLIASSHSQWWPLLFRPYPTALKQILARSLWSAADREYVFLSDGGHYDNLGLEALLMRRTRVIIAVDAGHDPDGRFVDLLKIVRRNRAMRGIEIYTSRGTDSSMLLESDLLGLKGRIAKNHFVVAHIKYPPLQGQDLDEAHRTGADVRDGYLIYVKPSFTGDEDATLSGYREENPVFPYDPTADQFYDQRRFESYRALGYHIGERLAARLQRGYEDEPDSRAWLATWNHERAGQTEHERPPNLRRYVEAEFRIDDELRGLLHSSRVEERSVAAWLISREGSSRPAPERHTLIDWLRAAYEREPIPEIRRDLLSAMFKFEEEAAVVASIVHEWEVRGLVNDPLLRLEIGWRRERMTRRAAAPESN